MRFVTKSSDPLAALANKRIWIAGARGFIGSCLSRELLLSGSSATVQVYGGDITDRRALAASIMEFRPHFLLNLAAPVDDRRDPDLRETMERVIVGGAQGILDCLTELKGRPRFLQVGTCEEYGAIEAPFAEDDPCGAPVSPYAAAKLEATRVCLNSRSNVVVARPFLTYGPGQRSAGLLPTLIQAGLREDAFAMTEGLQTREFNYVEDIARDLLELVACEEAEGKIVNLGCGEERRVVDVARLAWAATGASPGLLQVGAREARPAEIPRLFADVRLARQLIGQRQRRTLEDGLHATVSGIRARMSLEG